MSDFLAHLRIDNNEDANRIRILIDDLRAHPIYSSIRSIKDARIYMQNQVWCVWDFMTLIKSIQLKVTNTSIYWLPNQDASLGAYIYSVLLTEETDVDESGKNYASHFETYLRAMEEVGADTGPIKSFIALLRQGVSYEEASINSQMPKIARDFVNTTLRFAHSPLHITVAVFCLSRECIIPSMFKPFLENLPETNKLSIFRWYLNRHIILDSGSHGPLSIKLFKEAVSTDPILVKQALNSALEALMARKVFLDAIHELVKSGNSCLNE